MKAASGGHADCVKLLLDSGALADQQDTVCKISRFRLIPRVWVLHVVDCF